MSGKREEKRRRTSDIVLIVVGLFVLAFVVSMIVLFCKFQAVPDVLIQYTLGAGGIEALALAAIRISKEFGGDRKTVKKSTRKKDDGGIV